MRLTGWRLFGEKPPFAKYVFIAAPHTSNWDLAYMLAMATLLDMRISWMGKDTLFVGPMGWLMRRLGGIPIERHLRKNVVKATAEKFAQTDELALAVPAEGTRSYVDYWKSGFYHIAREANVPVVMSILDWSKREGGIGPSFVPSGDLVADMNKVRAFYAGATGRFPKKVGRIRLREEDAQLESTARAQGEPVKSLGAR